MSTSTCTCAAYPFPHRAGGGHCSDPGERPESCRQCMHGIEIRDPYATGDYWYTEIECNLGECPWHMEDAA